MPLGPSTKTFLVSAAVGATSATRFAAPMLTFSRTNSISDRVFPKPRPASSNQINQSSPGGGSWFGRAKHDQLSNPASMAAKSIRLSSDIDYPGTDRPAISPLLPAKHAPPAAPASGKQRRTSGGPDPAIKG